MGGGKRALSHAFCFGWLRAAGRNLTHFSFFGFGSRRPTTDHRPTATTSTTVLVARQKRFVRCAPPAHLFAPTTPDITRSSRNESGPAGHTTLSISLGGRSLAHRFGRTHAHRAVSSVRERSTYSLTPHQFNTKHAHERVVEAYFPVFPSFTRSQRQITRRA